MRPTPAFSTPLSKTDAAVDTGLRAYMLNVYKEMGIALVVSGAVASIMGRDLAIIQDQAAGAAAQGTLLPEGLYAALYGTPLVYVLMFAPLIAVLFMSFSWHRLSPSAARMALYGFAALMGASLATIFVTFTGVSIAQTFVATAAGMAGLSLYGYTTQKDLSGWGSFLFMGVIALIIASVINIFIGASALSFGISAIAVLIFSALMIYDTQRIKNDYLTLRHQASEDTLRTMGTAGALSMYLNFINVFISLLNMFGDRE